MLARTSVRYLVATLRRRGAEADPHRGPLNASSAVPWTPQDRFVGSALLRVEHLPPSAGLTARFPGTWGTAVLATTWRRNFVTHTAESSAAKAAEVASVQPPKAPLLSDFQARVLGNGSFILVAISFLSTDIFTLRALNVVAGGMSFFFNQHRNNVIGMKWGAFLLAINVFQIWALSREKRVGILPEREAAAYERFFAESGILSETGFWALSEVGEWQTLHKGTDITLQDCPNEWVYLVLDGEMFVHRHCDGGRVERELGKLHAGSWVGERGYLRQFALPRLVKRDTLTGPSFATVTVTSPTARVLRWRRSELQHEMDGSASANAAVLLSMTRDVVQKLRDQSELHSEDTHMQWRWALLSGRAQKANVKPSVAPNSDVPKRPSLMQTAVGAWRGIWGGAEGLRVDKESHDRAGDARQWAVASENGKLTTAYLLSDSRQRPQ
jgi:CRP-like cAMP-binding protein